MFSDLKIKNYRSNEVIQKFNYNLQLMSFCPIQLHTLLQFVSYFPFWL